MPLKLKTFNAPHIAILNRWADDKDNTLTSHQNQLNDLNGRINELLKANPGLINPAQK